MLKNKSLDALGVLFSEMSKAMGVELENKLAYEIVSRFNKLCIEEAERCFLEGVPYNDDTREGYSIPEGVLRYNPRE
jgi:hypothetical protein